MGNCNNERQQAHLGVDGLQYALLLRETISIIKIILDFLVRWHTGNLCHTIVRNDGSLWGANIIPPTGYILGYHLTHPWDVDSDVATSIILTYQIASANNIIMNSKLVTICINYLSHYVCPLLTHLFFCACTLKYV